MEELKKVAQRKRRKIKRRVLSLKKKRKLMNQLI
jgi:hypothetical protein